MNAPIDYFAIAVANTRQQFAPSTVRAEIAVTVSSGPRQCCADAGRVIACDGETDTWECWICGRAWEAPCR